MSPFARFLLLMIGLDFVGFLLVGAFVADPATQRRTVLPLLILAPAVAYAVVYRQP